MVLVAVPIIVIDRRIDVGADQLRLAPDVPVVARLGVVERRLLAPTAHPRVIDERVCPRPADSPDHNAVAHLTLDDEGVVAV